MNRAGLKQAALAGATALMTLLFVVQLGARADRAADRETAIRRDAERVTILLDRSLKESLLLNGWTNPIFGEGVWSISSRPTLRVPTSTAAGDVELTIALAAAEPYTHPLLFLAGDTPVGSWLPKTTGVEQVRVVVPARLRLQSYDLTVRFGLSGKPDSQGLEPAVPIRVVSVASRILRNGS